MPFRPKNIDVDNLDGLDPVVVCSRRCGDYENPSKAKSHKNKRRRKHGKEGKGRELLFKEDDQQYAKVMAMLGNSRVRAYCFDGMIRVCRIRGTMRGHRYGPRIWIYPDDLILVAIRNYQPDKADIIWKYSTEEADKLRTYGEIPKDLEIGDEIGKDDPEIEFTEWRVSEWNEETEDETSDEDEEVEETSTEEEEIMKK